MNCPTVIGREVVAPSHRPAARDACDQPPRRGHPCGSSTSLGGRLPQCLVLPTPWSRSSHRFCSARSITVQAMARAPSRIALSPGFGHGLGGELGLMVDRREAIESQHGMDRRDRPGDISHVGRSRRLGWEVAGVEHGASHFLAVGGEEINQQRVAPQAVVRVADGLDLDGAPGGQRRRLEACLHLRHHLVEAFAFGGPHIPGRACR